LRQLIGTSRRKRSRAEGTFNLFTLTSVDISHPAPRQQLIEPVDRMSVNHALEHVVQISIGLNVIHFAGLDERAKR
jgi:hypothetical protein